MSNEHDKLGSESAEEALRNIVEGFQRFRDEVFPQQEELFKKLAHEQKPRAMFITCADSRIVPELITQSSPGDLFVTRNVGNVVPPYGQMNGGVSTAIEFAVMALGVHHIIICGHSDCGAMKAVMDPQTLERMPTVKAWLRHAEVAKVVVQENCGCASHESLAVLTEENVVAQLDHLRTHPRWRRAWPADSCSSMAGSMTSRLPSSRPTMPSRGASARSVTVRCRWPRHGRATRRSDEKGCRCSPFSFNRRNAGPGSVPARRPVAGTCTASVSRLPPPWDRAVAGDRPGPTAG